MLRSLTATSNEWALTILRLAPGIVILPHGLQKVFGIWGGAGLAGIMSFFTTVVHMPAWLGDVVIATECLGGIALILGLLTRVAAFFVAVEMVCAVILVHLPNGFFMNWEAKLPAGAEGFEFHILMVAILIVLLIKGGGAASIDRALASR